MVEAEGEKLRDVLRSVRIAQIFEEVNVQAPSVGIHQAGCQAGQSRAEPGGRASCGRPSQGGIGRKGHGQQLARAVDRHHQDPDDEAAVQVGPQNRCRRQQNEIRNAGDARMSFAHSLQKEKEQRQNSSVNKCGRASQ
jgi:hypothetical protein